MDNIDTYLFFYPMGGFCDILKMIHYLLPYCRKHKRFLLLTSLDHYEIYVEDYFDISNEWIITDKLAITSILNQEDTSKSIYPSRITSDVLVSIMNIGKEGTSGKHIRNSFRLVQRHNYIHKCTSANVSVLPNTCSQKIIFYVGHGRYGSWSDAYRILRSMYVIHPDIHYYVRSSMMRIGEDYACIQIRHTDKKTNYMHFIHKYINWLKKAEVLYVCTDSRDVLDAIRNIVPHALNFTCYPEGSYYNLHCSAIDPFLKMRDLIFDMYVSIHATSFICNNVGGFSSLIQQCRRDMYSFVKRD